MGGVDVGKRGAGLLNCLAAARQRKFTSLDPPHAGHDVGESVDRAPLALHDRPEPPSFSAAICEVPTAKKLRQLRRPDPRAYRANRRPITSRSERRFSELGIFNRVCGLHIV